MNLFRKLFDFFLFSSLYISICALVMIHQTDHLLIDAAPSYDLSAFVFFSTMCSYNFHWWLTPYSTQYSSRIQWANEHKGWHLILYLVGLLGSAFFFYMLREHWLALSFAAFITFLYSAPKLPQTIFKELKKVAIGKTLYLAIVWTYVTTILPLIVADASIDGKAILFIISRFGLIYSICILFDYRDREDDKKNAIRSMITYFNEVGINRIFWLSLAISALATITFHFRSFSWPIAFCLMTPILLTAALYSYSKKNFSDHFYYFVLDGLMMLSGLIMMIFGI